MDPIAHTFTGATLAAAGLRRATPLATATLLIGVNAPDIDAVAYFGEPFQSFAFRRGVTHGVLALAIWPFAIAALVLAWDRIVRLTRSPHAPPARAGPVLVLAALAVLTHPALDWLNHYGLRWLMPFDGTWFYGDALVVIDPWIWLMLGGVPFLVYSQGRGALLAWSALWALATLVVLMAGGVPIVSRALWVAGVAALLCVRAVNRGAPDPVRDKTLERGARSMLALAAAYVGTMVIVDFVERGAVRGALADRGIASVERVMVAPAAANPFAGEVVAATPISYYLGSWSWFSEPRLTLAPAPIERNETDPVFIAAAATAEARRFLTWARFPFALVAADADGYTVSFLDARYYATGRLFGPIVRLDPNLQPSGSE